MNRTRIPRETLSARLNGVVEPGEREAILKRALTYPYATPERSYLYREGRAEELPEDFDLSGRTPLISYGANAAPEALALKLASLPGEPLPVVRSELRRLRRRLLRPRLSLRGGAGDAAREPRNRRPRLRPPPDRRAAGAADGDGAELRPGQGRRDACLPQQARLPRARRLARWRWRRCAPRGRTLPELDQPAVLERVRAHLEPELELEEFVHACIERGGIKPLPRLTPL